ncbi:MAG: lipid-A-disaccharide synthase [Duodenibacillus sp.]|nr:lipid-A-disaccharide synthase [Duodenibacillus sp.]
MTGVERNDATAPAPGTVWLAGEASGDFLASLVLPQLKERMHGASQVGVGGPKMRAAGLTPWADSERLAVRGYVEVIKKLPGLLRFRREILARVQAERPRLFIGVDAPDFNLGVEVKLRSAGIKTVHFVSPSIWAWRAERIHKIRQAVDHMLLIFPFEEAIYRREGIPATYIGHPLAGIIPMHPDKEAARTILGLTVEGGPLIAVLPGSRVDEVSGCAPVFFEACERLVERTGGAARFVLPAVDETRRRQIDAVAAHWPHLAERLTIVTGNSHRVLESADGVMVASGTATLEAALYKKPMVVGYTMPGLSAMLMKKKGLIPYVSLPNILAGRPLVPELLHYFCTPDALAATLLDEMRPARVAELTDIYEAMHDSLLRPTADLACNAIEHVLGDSL